MPKPSHLRGMLLEEAILYLLRASGYKTVEYSADDATLDDSHPADQDRFG